MAHELDQIGIHPLLPELEARLELAVSINLRDLGEVTAAVQEGLVYRSSEVVSPTQLRQLRIKVRANSLF